MPVTTWTLLPAEETTDTALERASASYEPGVDWQLDADGDLEVPVTFTTGAAAVVQGIRIRLQTFLGEWFLDLDAGVDYFGVILGQKFDELAVKAEFREAILAAPGVDELLLLTAEFDSTTRIVTVRWKVRTTFGVVAGSTEA